MAQEQSISARRGLAMELVRNRGFVALGELAEALGVSGSTARRDLEVLEETGSLRRTHATPVQFVPMTGEAEQQR